MFLKNKTLIFILFLFPLLVTAQLTADTSAQRSKQQLLNEYRDQAAELYNAFKNGPAFDNLRKYSELKENIYKEQAAEEVKKKELAFQNEISAQQKKLSEINKEIQSLKDEQGSLISEKNKLIRNTFLYFLLIIGIAVFIIMSRSGAAAKETAFKNVSSQQLFHIRKLSDVADKVTSSLKDILFSFQSMQDLSLKTKAALAKLKSLSVTMNRNTESIAKQEQCISTISSLSSEAKVFSDHLDLLMKEEQEEKKLSNLNKIIEESLHLSFHWMRSRDENFDSNITKDLEKILPEINIIPGAIGQALFHFFNNAFQSVHAKKMTGENNFQPKVSVSSRKLPRFVQVRIKDNGKGIDPKFQQKIFEPFFSTRSPELSSGLGLTAGSEIIKEKHQGEIIIESEAGNGTDLVIRFPLNTLL